MKTQRWKVTLFVDIEEGTHPRKFIPEAVSIHLKEGEGLFDYKFEEETLFTFNAEDVRKSLAIDAGYYEDEEDWDNHQLVMDLFKFVTENAVDGVIRLNQEQKIILDFLNGCF